MGNKNLKQVILLLEDEEDVRFMMSEMLEFMDFEVDIANAGDEAIKLAKKKEYDFYLIDIVMAGKSGLEALAEMDINNKSEKVVIVSANINDQNRDIARNMGIKKFLPKPIKMGDLEQTLS